MGNTNNVIIVEPVTNVDGETNEALENEKKIEAVTKIETKTENQDKDKSNEVRTDYTETSGEDCKALDSLESEEDHVTDHLNEVKESSGEASVVTLKWSGNADSVQVVGEFSNWHPLTMSEFEKDLWKIQLKLKPGSYQLKFLVDGEDRLSEYMETVINEREETFNRIDVDIMKETITINDIDIMHATNVTDVLTIADAKTLSHYHGSEKEETREAVAAGRDEDEVTDVNIQWKGRGDSVMVSGEFSNWSGISLAKTHSDIWSVKLRLKLGEYLMLFFVDGEIVLSEDMEKIYSEEDEDTYNLLKVKKEDLELEDRIMPCSTRVIEPMHIRNAPCLEISSDENQVSDHTDETSNLHKDSLTDHDGVIDANNDGCEKQIVWPGFASNVRIIGDFSNWTPISLSNQGGEDWQVTLKLSEGPHLLKFIVDEKFTLSEMMEKVIGPDQEVYNLVHAGTNNSQTYEIR